MVKILAFTISKQYFYNFNTLFYNIPNIKTSIFFTTSFKYYFFIIFYSFFVFIFFILSLQSHCLSPSPSLPLSLTVSPSLLLGLTVSTQQSYPPLATSHHNSNDHHNDQRPTLMRPMPIKLMTHTDEIDQVNDPRMQTHELRPTNLDPQNRRSTSPKHIKPRPTTIAEAQSSMEHRERREKKEVREERER